MKEKKPKLEGRENNWHVQMWKNNKACDVQSNLFVVGDNKIRPIYNKVNYGVYYIDYKFCWSLSTVFLLLDGSLLSLDFIP